MTKQMILQGGPLDGEKQVVLDLNTTPGYNMQFSLENFQNFHPDGVTVASQGLVAVYTFLGPGPAPNPGSPAFDTWDTSWIYKFTGEVTIPPPSPITPPTIPPQLSPAVFMGANTTLTINANDPGPGVLLTAETILEVDATSVSVGYATLAMVGETSMSITRQTWDNKILMAGVSSLAVNPT